MTRPDDAARSEGGFRLPRRRDLHHEGRNGSSPAADGEDLPTVDAGTVDATQVNLQSAPSADHTQVTPKATSTQKMPEQPVEATQHMSNGPAAPDRVGRFEIVDLVGEGGMGVVYRAIDTESPNRREVALKVLRPHIAYDPQARTRLAREVATLERVSHPNVAAVIDADPYGDRPYIATEFVPGIPLDDVIKQDGPFSPSQLADLGRDLADAVEAIHRAGVVHRDLKPSNVLMVGSTPVLIDFGIAHIADDARLTSTGLVMGTPGYLSPELIEGGEVTTSTDWWGWAATLAFAAQGEPPFGRGPMPAVLDRVTRGQANVSGVDERLRPLLAAALSPDPSRRPSATRVIEEIDRYARGEYTTVVPVASPDGGVSSIPANAQERRDRRQFAPRRVDAQQPQPPRPAPTASSPQAQQPPYRNDAPQNNPYPQRFQGAPSQDRPQSAPIAPRGVAPSGRPRLSQQYPGEHDPRIHLAARSGVLGALLFAWVGIMAVAPVTGAILMVLWNIAARFADSTITQTVLRRYEAGRRKSDGAVAVASAPWHVVRASVSTVFAVLLPTFVFACVTALVAVAYAVATGQVPRAFWALPLIPAAAAAGMTFWRGLASVSYRRGSRSVARAIAPSDESAKIVAGVLGALGLFFLASAALQHGDISWLPLPGGYSDPLSEYLPSIGQ